MAVVLSSAEENSYFSSSTLRRSHSQPKFGTKRGGFHTSASASRINDLYRESREVFGESIASSPTPSLAVHPESSDLSCASTPASTFSVASDCSEVDHLESVTTEDLSLPRYDGGYFNHVEDLDPPSPRTDRPYVSSPNELETSTTTSRPGTPDLLDRAEDDIALRAQPSRQVDYLSHNWREEDIWSSWKLIVSRRGDYANAARLENASWRTWMKSKNKLSTVSPETLNWLKDCDVTWLYGPLQTGGTSSMNPIHTGSNSGRLSKSNSFTKKPILKKRSMSELMLQRSLSTSSLVKQAAAAVQAQQKDGARRHSKRPGLGRAITDYVAFPFSSRGVSHDNTSLFPSAASSGFVSPSGERRHIHFNEQVEQCIAVEVKGEDDEDDVDVYAYNNSDSDDGAIMMKRTKSKRRRPTIRKAKSHNSSSESKTIAMLPSTTLKYREDTPEPTETAMKHSTTMFRSPLGSPSSSQETLRPSRKSGKLFISSDDEDEDDESGAGASYMDPPPTPKASENGSGLGLKRSTSSSSLATEPTGMRRTESGMFMPFENGESGTANEGLLGRVIDTVNTARDIAHVIWNVGWRK